MAWQLGAIVASIEAETSQFQKGLKRAVSLARRAASRIGSAFRGIGRIFKTLLRPLNAVKNALVSLPGLIGAFAAYRLVDMVTDAQQLSIAFGNLQNSIGATASVTLEKLRKATRGTASDLELMRAANNAVLLGVGKSSEEFAKLAEAGRRLGKAVGRDALSGFNDLVTGIGRQSRMILDNLGLIVSVGKANQEYAAQLGKTVNQLTDAEKKTAFLNAALAAIEDKLQSLGVDTETMAERFGRLRASIENFVLDIGRLIVPRLSKTADKIATIIKENKDDIVKKLSGIMAVISTFIKEVQKRIEDGSLSIKDAIEEMILIISRLVANSVRILVRGAIKVIKDQIPWVYKELIETGSKLVVDVLDSIRNVLKNTLPGMGADLPLMDAVALELLGHLTPVSKGAKYMEDRFTKMFKKMSFKKVFEKAFKGLGGPDIFKVLDEAFQKAVKEKEEEPEFISKRRPVEADVRALEHAMPSTKFYNILQAVDKRLGKVKEKLKTKDMDMFAKAIYDIEQAMKAARESSKLSVDQLDRLTSKFIEAKEKVRALQDQFEKQERLKQFNKDMDRLDQAITDVTREIEVMKRGEIAVTIDEWRKYFKSAGLEGENLAKAMKKVAELKEKLEAKKAREDLEEKIKEQKRVWEEMSGTLLQGIADAFAQGKSLAKGWADTAARLWQNAMNRAIKDVSKFLADKFQGLLEKLGMKGGYGGIASGLIAVGGAIWQSMQQRTTATVEDFDKAITSTEAMRGVVAGPSNVAIATVSDAMKEALRTTEMLLTRIANAVEQSGGMATTGTSMERPLTSSTPT